MAERRPERIEPSHPDKAIFPEDGIDKAALVDYYSRVGDRLLAHFAGRPLSLKRAPDGIGGESFFQKRVADHFPDWLPRVEVPIEGGSMAQPVVRRAQDLAWLADQGAVEFHGALSPAEAPDRPDRLILDFDPPSKADDEAGRRAWAVALVDAARRARDLLHRLDAPAFVMSSGSRGLHVLTPLDGTCDFEASRALARALAERLAADDPARLTTAQRKADRGARLFVDWLRNGYGQTTVLPYSLRALPGAPVAAPLDWDELSDDFDPQRITRASLFRRLGQRADPWANLYKDNGKRRRLSATALSERLDGL